MQARQRSGHVFIIHTYTHTYYNIYIYYLDFFIIHTRYAKTSKTSKHEFTRKARSQTTAHPKLLFRLSSFLFLEHQSVNAKRRALIILSNRAKVLRNSQDKLIPANLWVSPFFLEKLHQTKHRFSCAYFLGGLYQVHIVLTSHQTFHHQGDFAFRNARSFLGHFAFKLKFFSVSFLRVSAAKVNVNCRFLFFVHFCFWNISEC